MRTNHQLMKEISDIDLVKGLINRDAACISEFRKKFRQQVYHTIDVIYEELSVTPPKTESAKEELFLALCDHLHHDEDRQLKEYLEDKRKPALETWLLHVKLPDFLPDKIVVDGLIHSDPEITKMFVSAINEHSLKGMLKMDYFSAITRDYNHGGEPMKAQDLICEMYSLIMFGEDTKKDKNSEDTGRSLQIFKFDSHLKTYINKMLKALPRYTKYIRGKTGQEKELTEKHNKIAYRDAEVEVDPENLGRFIEEVFQIMSRTERGKRDVTFLKEYDLSEKKITQKELAKKYGVSEDDMAQKIRRARKHFRDICCRHYGFTAYYQIFENYG